MSSSRSGPHARVRDAAVGEPDRDAAGDRDRLRGPAGSRCTMTTRPVPRTLSVPAAVAVRRRRPSARCAKARSAGAARWWRSGSRPRSWSGRGTGRRAGSGRWSPRPARPRSGPPASAAGRRRALRPPRPPGRPRRARSAEIWATPVRGSASPRPAARCRPARRPRPPRRTAPAPCPRPARPPAPGRARAPGCRGTARRPSSKRQHRLRRPARRVPHAPPNGQRRSVPVLA